MLTLTQSAALNLLDSRQADPRYSYVANNQTIIVIRILSTNQPACYVQEN